MVLIGAGTEQLGNLFDDAAQIEGGGGATRTRPASILEKSEDVVDDAEQGFGGAADGFGVIALGGIELGREQQAGHADHPVHGGADFMAHVGQEVTLEVGGIFGGGQGAGEFAVLLLQLFVERFETLT